MAFRLFLKTVVGSQIGRKQRKLLLEINIFINEEVSERDKFRRKRIFPSLQLILCFSTKLRTSLFIVSFLNLLCVIGVSSPLLWLSMNLMGIFCTRLGVCENKTGTSLMHKCASALLLMHTSVWYIHSDTSHLPRHAWGRSRCRVNQGTTPWGDPVCYPANYWPMRYGSA